MDKLAILPFFGAAWLLFRTNDARKVFVNYFLPILTLIPAYYETKLVSGIPEFSFWSSALIPVIIIWFVNERMEGYKFSWLDVIIILHIIFIFYAQFEATGYKDAQKITFREILMRLMPYLVLKAIVMDKVRRVDALVVITTLGAVVAVFMAYEFRMYVNMLDTVIRKIWPYYVPWDGALTRFGFKRAAGSFAHPISAGYFYSMSAPLAFWLFMHKKYPVNGRLGLLILGLNILGALFSISRAPIAGLLLSSLIIWFGWSKSKSVSGGFLILSGIIALSVTIPKFVEYVSVTRSSAVTQDQENAAYRKEMLDNYIEVIQDKPAWGYGRYTFPVINKQRSIDNEYLYMAITSGLVNLSVYIILIVSIFVRLLSYTLKQTYDSPEGRFGWVMLGVWISAVFTQATVYSGMQTTHYFFMMAAIAEGLIQSGLGFSSTNDEESLTEPVFSGHGYNFSRTL